MYYNLETICELCGEKININCQDYDSMIYLIKCHLVKIPIPLPLKFNIELQICEQCTENLFVKDDGIALSELQDFLIRCRIENINEVIKNLSNRLDVSLTNENVLRDTLERVL